MHYRKNALDKINRDVRMKKITHGINKDTTRLFPTERKLQDMFMGAEAKTIGVIWMPHCLEAPGHSLGITVLTPRANFGAARDWVP
jgi:hypothetical protein